MDTNDADPPLALKDSMPSGRCNAARRESSTPLKLPLQRTPAEVQDQRRPERYASSSRVPSTCPPAYFGSFVCLSTEAFTLSVS